MLVAYSGGVDSTLVAKLAFQWLEANAAAATAVSPSLAKADLDEAVAVAHAIGIPHHQIRSSETDLPVTGKTAPALLFLQVDRLRPLRGVRANRKVRLRDGRHQRRRHGRAPARAARGPRTRRPQPAAKPGSPGQVRAWAAELGLSNWDKPSNACLSSRVPYGMEVNPLKLTQIETAESGLRALGFRQCRVRHHGQVARIEVEPSDLPRALAQREELLRATKRCGLPLRHPGPGGVPVRVSTRPFHPFRPMSPELLRELLEEVAGGSLGLDDALARLAALPYEGMGHAGGPSSRSAPGISRYHLRRGQDRCAAHRNRPDPCPSGRALATRVDAPEAAAVLASLPDANYDPLSRILHLGDFPAPRPDAPLALVICAGTSDLPVAGEAAQTLAFLGDRVEQVTDVGVAGLHRLLSRLDALRAADVIIAVAGMEGALAVSWAGWPTAR
ncbi:MAG: asparagine synthase-related protein [Kiritimatiellia bacterium]